MPDIPEPPTVAAADPALATRTSAPGGSTAEDQSLRSVAAAVPTVPGYEVLSELGQGAMGVVYQARDLRLNRVVAIKMVLGGPQADANRFVRFLVEAEAVAAIKHPHVVQVYEFGEAQGRPFLALEFLPGGTLADRLGSPLGTRPAIELLLPIARGVAASHELGIVHRDLKPGNVLFNEAGVPKVTDFGLAKLGTGSGLTETHAVLGTPAYMSPEQAWGNAKFVGPQADVWAVGVMLYEALTGQRPFQGDTVRALLTRVVTTDPVPPRKLVPSIPRDLELICLKCLAKQPHERYPTAKELAEDLERFTRGDSISVRPPGLVERAAKWTVRNKVLAGSAAAMLVAGTAFAWWADRQRAERREAELRQQLKDERLAEAERQRLVRNGDTVARLLKECAEALSADDTATAGTLLNEATANAAEGGADHLAERIARMRAELAMLRELDRIDELRWASADGIAWANRAADEEWPPAFRRFGIVPTTTPVAEAVARINESPVKERMLAALHMWLGSSRSPDVLALLNAVDPDEYRSAVRRASAADDFARFKQFAADRQAAEQPVWFLPLVGEHGLLPVAQRDAVLQTAVLRNPGKLSTLMALGTIHPIGGVETGREREKWMRAAVAVRSTSAMTRNNLGVALYEQGKLNEAAVEYRAAARLDPNSSLAHSNLGATLLQLGRLDEALHATRLAVKLDPGSALAQNTLGNVLLEQSRALRDRGEPHEAIRTEAIAALRRAIAIQPTFAPPHNNLGNVLSDSDDLDGACTAYQNAIACDPTLGEAYSNLGNVLREKGDLHAAVAAYRAAISLKPHLHIAHADLGDVLHQLDDLDGAMLAFTNAHALDSSLATTHNNFGLLKRTRGELDGAIAEFELAIKLDPRMAKAHCNLGNALKLKGEPDKAVGPLKEAIRLDPKFADPHNTLGKILFDKRDLDGAVTEFRLALQIAPNFADAHHNLGLVFHNKRDFPAAIKAYRKAIELHDTDSSYHNNLGIVLAYTDDLDGAISAYKKAIALKPGFAQAHNNLAAIYLDREQYPEAIASARAAIKADPKYAIAHALLGTALRETGDIPGARAALTEAARLDPKRLKPLLAQLPPPATAPEPREVNR